ncbi:MAG TPA: diguanylate cyclase, partial [Polyangiaceae bacterium]|nr:diguanylate cyclase [Polyangiaceae bacterium]
MTTLLRTKRLLWLLIFAIVTVMAWLSYLSGRRYVRAVAWVEHTLQVQATIDDVLSAVVDAEDSSRGFLLTQDDDRLAASRAATARVPALLAHLGELTRDNASQQVRLRKLSALANDKLLFIAETMRLSQSGEQTEALALVRGGGGVALMTELRSAASAMDREEHRLLELRKRAAEQAQSLAIWGVGVGSVLTIAMSLVSLLSVHRDVEELRQTAEELAERERYFRLLTENSRDLVRIADFASKVTYVSPSVERMLGYTQEELLALPPLSLVHPDDVALFQPRPEPIYDRYKGAQLEYRIRHKDGSYHWLEINFAPHLDAAGEVVGIQSSARDVTERHVAEEQLAAQAAELRSLSLCDELTGLYNRRGWLELSRQGLRLAQREKRAAGVIFVDLNGMKLINDQYGHEEGDRALRDTAGLLKKACREVDVIARFGGDEFVVFALDFDPSGLEVLQGRVRAASTELNLSGNRPFQLSMSVGAAFFEPETPESIDELLD